MRKLILLVFFMLMIVPLSSAQEDYRLRVPSAEAYLTTIIENAEDLNSLQIRTILAEVHQRFGNTLSTANFDLLRTAFRVLFADMGPYGYGYLPHQEDWERAKLLAWLRENDIDLAETDSLVFDDYDIQVTAVDFSGDGQDEYILDVVRGCEVECRPAVYLRESAEYQEFLVLEQEQAGEFYLISTPLPWLSNQYHYAMSQSSSLKPLQIVDINDDGLPEWLMMSLFSIRRDALGVRLYILGWRDGQLVELTDEPLSYRDYTNIGDYDQLNVWSFNKEGSSVSIEQRAPKQDNWRCMREEITQYIWNGEQFELRNSEVVFPDTFECFIRNAEAAFYAYDFEASIILYEQALALNEQANYADYARVRLAIAHALNGDFDAGITHLSANDTDDDNAVPELVNAIFSAYTIPSLPQVCLAAYNFFVDEPHYLLRHFDLVGGRVTDEQLGYLSFFIPPSPPAQAGCDVDWLLNQILENVPFTIDTSPAEQLEQLGWPVSQTFSADLNSDGIDEWLIWLDSEMLHPVLFVSNGDKYRASRFTHVTHDPYQPSELYIFEAIELPDGHTGLATLDYVISHPYWLREGSDRGGGSVCETPLLNPDSYSAAYLGIWRLVNDELERLFFGYVCEVGEIRDFVDDNTVKAWTAFDYDNLVEEIYTWDDAAQTFTAPPLTTPTTPYPVEETLPSPQTILFEALGEYTNGNFSETLEDADSLLERTTDIESDELSAARYYRALALEALGRTDEALAEYIAIYEAAPESAWGMLAALHLEVVDGE